MLEAQNLTKDFNGSTALKDVSLKVHPGDVFCLLGANGAGKTTLINIFLGFIAPSSGQVLIDGINIHQNENASKSKVAYIPEVVMLYGNLTGLENLAFFSRLSGYKYSKDELAKFLSGGGLQSDAFTRRVSTYSKGMRQKVGIAIALAKNASALLMDEPTSGLDPKASNEFSVLVKKLGAEGKAVFMATHDIFNSADVGTRIGIIKEGNLLKTVQASSLDAKQLQELYLQTIN
jgi:ABC-2 type transport system ATP-binding protein